jgi:hypothetical protein
MHALQKFGVVRHECLCLMRGQEPMHACMQGNRHAHRIVGYSWMPGCSHVMQGAKERWKLRLRG